MVAPDASHYGFWMEFRGPWGGWRGKGNERLWARTSVRRVEPRCLASAVTHNRPMMVT